MLEERNGDDLHSAWGVSMGLGLQGAVAMGSNKANAVLVKEKDNQLTKRSMGSVGSIWPSILPLRCDGAFSSNSLSWFSIAAWLRNKLVN